jgi:thiaminase
MLKRMRRLAFAVAAPSDLEQTPPAVEMLAYTRYVLDAGMRGDLLALKVALAPCVIGYAEIATRLASRPGAHAATNPYGRCRPRAVENGKGHCSCRLVVTAS